MSTSTTQHHTETVAHAFADLMNGHDPDAVDSFIPESARLFWAFSELRFVLRTSDMVYCS
jgi:hypothetical protein